MTRIKLLPALLLALIGASLGGCYRHLPDNRSPEPDPAQYTLERKLENITYTDAGWPQALQGDLYLPDRRGAVPVVITIHGGGWANRSREDMESVSEKLVRHGYAVFNIAYRFAPRFTYPAQREDIEQALAWIVANADRYRFDTARINAWGYSSGAHLAALLASYDAKSSARALPRIRAVVAGGIPADLRQYNDSPIVTRFMGGGRDEIFARYADASPAYHISSDDPPVFLYHGKLDLLVSPQQSTDYYTALRNGGVEAELYLHNLLGHMTMFLFGGDAEDKAIAFLDRKNSTWLNNTPRTAARR